MGKNKGGIPQKEQFQRIQYLYQVVAIVAVVFVAYSHRYPTIYKYLYLPRLYCCIQEDWASQVCVTAHWCLKTNPIDLNLCRYYLHILRNIVKKTVLRLHVDIKRTLCKKCCVLLIPGVTATVRTRSKKQKHLVVTCLECDTIKRFPLNKGYKLWLEKPEAWLDSVQPTENNSTQGTEGKKIINKQ